jgi:hypothetical protein
MKKHNTQRFPTGHVYVVSVRNETRMFYRYLRTIRPFSPEICEIVRGIVMAAKPFRCTSETVITVDNVPHKISDGVLVPMEKQSEPT